MLLAESDAPSKLFLHYGPIWSHKRSFYLSTYCEGLLHRATLNACFSFVFLEWNKVEIEQNDTDLSCVFGSRKYKLHCISNYVSLLFSLASISVLAVTLKAYMRNQARQLVREVNPPASWGSWHRFCWSVFQREMLLNTSFFFSKYVWRRERKQLIQ